MFRANVRVFLARFCNSNFSLSGLCKSGCGFLRSGFLFQKPVHLLRVSSVILSCLNELFGVVSPFSTALHIPSGFSNRRFETAPDLSFSKHVKLVLAKRQVTSNHSFRLGN